MSRAHHAERVALRSPPWLRAATFGRRSRVLPVLILIWWVVSGCALDAVTPRPESIEPGWVFNGVDTPVRVIGQDFRPALEVDARGGARPAGDGGFSVLLRRDEHPDTPLIGVVQQELGRIGAVVPAGVEAGEWQVVVRAASGREGVAPTPLVVSDTRAAMIALEADSLVYTIFDEATVRLRVVDPSGEQVASPLAVRVEITGDTGEALDAKLNHVGLTDAESLEGAFGAEGLLSDDGEATLRFTLRAPETVTLRVTALDADAGITGADLRLLWRPGGNLRSRIRLPSDDLRLAAGESFTATVQLIDQFGTEIDAAGEVVVLRDACASWAEAVVLDGETPVQVVPRRATGTPECPENWVEVLSGAAGRSPSFRVDPGPLAALNVAVSPATVRAGEVLDAFITPVDAFGNRAQWAGSLSEVEDTLGGVLDANCTQGIPRYCAVRSTIAGDAVRLDVRDADGVGGRSAPYAVTPGDPATVHVTTTATNWTAGQETPVQVTLRDAYANIAEPPSPAPEVSILDAGTEIVCEPDASAGPLDQRCVLFTAAPTNALTATVDGVGQSAPSAPFAVRNGPIDAMILTPELEEVAAGAALAVEVHAFDAWGNPWTVQEPRSLGVRFGQTEAGINLDGQGRGEVAVTSERAGPLTLQGVADGAASGPARVVEVVAAPATALSVRAGAPWVTVGAPIRIFVEATDTYGNRDTRLPPTSVTLTAASGLAPSVSASLNQGFGSTTMVWSATDTNARVDAVSSGLAGVSDPFLAYAECGGAGPTPSLRFGSHSTGIVCAADAAAPQAEWAASLQGSTAGGMSSLFAWGLSVEGGEAQIGITPTFQGAVQGLGRHEVTGLVMQADGCGAVSSGDLWVGLDDGSPTGPVALSVDRDELTLGDPLAETIVEVAGVVDCHRDPASGATLRVRATRGDLLDVSPTGSGLQLALDAFGEGVLRWSATARSGAGVGALYAWSPQGTAAGAAEIELVGDVIPPTVWDQAPRGALDAPVNRITLTMSKAIDPTTVLLADPVLSQPGQPPIVLDPELGADARVLDLWLPHPLAPESSLWTLRLEDELRDVDGNRLDGDESGAEGGAYEGGVGGNASAPATPSCSLDVSRFRPDGDPGVGDEADVATLSFESTATPARWVVTVLDAEGARLRRVRLAASGPTASWAWDGRDTSERVLPNASYTLAVAAEGVDRARSAPCVRSVEIDNRGG